MPSTAVSAALPATQSVSKTGCRPNPARRKASKAKTLNNESSAMMNTKARAEPQTSSKGQPRETSTSTIVKAFAGKTKSNSAEPVGNRNYSISTKPNQLRKFKATSSCTVTDDTRPESNRSTAPLPLAAPAAVTGGLLGCAAGAAIILGAGLWKNFAGAENAILTARTAKLCIDNLVEEIITSLRAGTYNAPEALDVLRRTTLAYAGSIPGGAPLVERTFREIDLVRRQRGAEVDTLLAEASLEVARARQKGANADELQEIVFKQMMRLSTFATTATQDVLARNPKLRPCHDGAVKALRRPPESKVPTVKVNLAVRHCGPFLQRENCNYAAINL